MVKKLSDDELDELKKLLASNNQIAKIAVIMGAISALITAVGTATAALISALRTGK